MRGQEMRGCLGLPRSDEWQSAHQYPASRYQGKRHLECAWAHLDGVTIVDHGDYIVAQSFELIL